MPLLYLPSFCPEQDFIFHRFARNRFMEKVAVLVGVYFLSREARINLLHLSPDTTYAAILIFKTEREPQNVIDIDLKASVSHEDRHEEKVVRVNPSTVAQLPSNHIRFPVESSNEWKELELGQFYCDESRNQEVVVRLQETNTAIKKAGLIVAGVSVRHIPT